MEVLDFIFGLGIAFSIFGFLWWCIMLGVNFIRGNAAPQDNQRKRQSRQIQDYVLRIIKYFLLISVTANYIVKYEDGLGGGGDSWANTILGVIVLGLYLMGKLQRRTMLNMLSQHPILSRFSTSIDPKVERYLLSGSLVYFIFCLQYPGMVNNAVVNWFTDSIVNIYDTPVIGWVFAVIAFFFLVNIIFRGANVIGSLITGQPINPTNNMGGGFQQGSNPFEQFRQKQQEDDGFVDYEDVTDEEDKDSEEK